MIKIENKLFFILAFLMASVVALSISSKKSTTPAVQAALYQSGGLNVVVPLTSSITGFKFTVKVSSWVVLGRFVSFFGGMSCACRRALQSSRNVKKIVK